MRNRGGEVVVCRRILRPQRHSGFEQWPRLRRPDSNLQHDPVDQVGQGPLRPTRLNPIEDLLGFIVLLEELQGNGLGEHEFR